MKILKADEVQSEMVERLGMDPSILDLTTVEAIAAAIRRAAGLYCPCSPATLVRAVLKPLEGIIDDDSALQELIENTLDAIVAHGDLLEARDVSNTEERDTKNLLYLAPPSFVMRESGAVLLGIVPEHNSALPSELELSIEYCNYIRRLPPGIADLQARLSELGLVEISYEAWLRLPHLETGKEHLERLGFLLQSAPPAIDVPGFSLIDPTKSVRYYRGRWTDKLNSNGRFVGRRPQAYGADLWCYFEMVAGKPVRFFDLPLQNSRFRGCDEAWHLQAALDAERNSPQVVRVQHDRGFALFDLFSPVPMWARRRWDAIGEPLSRKGCLFSYKFSENEVEEELRFARQHLWLAACE